MRLLIQLSIIFAGINLLGGCASNGVDTTQTVDSSPATQTMGYMYRSPPPAAVSAMHLGGR